MSIDPSLDKATSTGRNATLWLVGLILAGLLDLGPAAAGTATAVCLPGRIVAISSLDEAALRTQAAKQNAIIVGVEGSGEIKAGLDALTSTYPDITFTTAPLPRSEMAAALNFGLIEVTTYGCDVVLAQPAEFAERFEGLNAWLIGNDTAPGAADHADKRGPTAVLDGVYTVQGANPDGSRYAGICKVMKIGENRFRFEWSVGNSYRGEGTLVGDILTVDWGSDAPVIYKVTPDGKLEGTWANGRATESLVLNVPENLKDTEGQLEGLYGEGSELIERKQTLEEDIRRREGNIQELDREFERLTKELEELEKLAQPELTDDEFDALLYACWDGDADACAKAGVDPEEDF